MSNKSEQGDPDYQAFNEICLAAVKCNYCFGAGYAKNSYIDVAQPRYVGQKYWSATRRVLLIEINPGAGKTNLSDQKMRDEILRYKFGELQLSALFELQHGHMPAWGNGRFLKYINSIGCDVQDIALLNVAWCATLGNEYPDKMLNFCFSNHTRKAIDSLQPSVIVACGRKAKKYVGETGLSFIEAPHYAARHTINYDAIRRSLGMAASTLSEIPLTVTHATHTPHQIGYVRTEVIRLLRPSNPKIGKSRLRFDCYKDGMSVAEYKSTVRERLGLVEAGKCGGDLKYDTRHNFIRIEGT